MQNCFKIPKVNKLFRGSTFVGRLIDISSSFIILIYNYKVTINYVVTKIGGMMISRMIIFMSTFILLTFGSVSTANAAWTLTQGGHGCAGCEICASNKCSCRSEDCDFYTQDFVSPNGGGNSSIKKNISKKFKRKSTKQKKR